MVDHLASGGRLYVPSAKVASSKNAARIFSSSGSSPCSIKIWRNFSIPSSYFSPINLKNTSVSIISRFSKNEPELRAARKISLHLKRIESRLIVSSVFFFAIILVVLSQNVPLFFQSGKVNTMNITKIFKLFHSSHIRFAFATFPTVY